MKNNIKADDEGFVHGYATPDGEFLGYAPLMTLVPDIAPAKYNVTTKEVVFTGNLRTKNKPTDVVISDAGFNQGGNSGGEVVLSGLKEDAGSDLVSKGGVPGFQMSDELTAKIAARHGVPHLPAASADPVGFHEDELRDVVLEDHERAAELEAQDLEIQKVLDAKDTALAKEAQDALDAKELVANAKTEVNTSTVEPSTKFIPKKG